MACVGIGIVFGKESVRFRRPRPAKAWCGLLPWVWLNEGVVVGGNVGRWCIVANHAVSKHPARYTCQLVERLVGGETYSKDHKYEANYYRRYQWMAVEALCAHLREVAVNLR